ncbi:microtubule binding protein [Rickenella mellea]|uniref:Coronin n=1 Tax=Rickenella mellea TaxID=50990 RepID=A0A4Y7QFR3_9AGAM|nr:microtubule binding protein [Rickenella mellea]
MSRFVRASKYRHVFGQAAKKEHCIDNVKVSNSAWDTNLIAASGSYISVNWNASGGGAFAILPLPSPFRAHNLPYKLPDVIPLARGHTAPVLDTDWSPHDDSLVVSGGEDGNILLWKVDADAFEGWGAERWVPQDFDPVARINGSPRKIGQVLFHPTAKHVLASASGEHTIKLWDLAYTDDAKGVLTGHTDTIQSMAFNMTGTLMATTCRDRKLRLFDPRAGIDAVRVTDGHGGIKGTRVIWMGDKDNIATTGFSKMSDRQVAIWETGSLENLKTVVLDQSSGVVMPFWSDNNILFLAGKGDGNIRYFEYESEALHSLSEYQSPSPQRGMCFLPRRSLSVSECEIARAYKVAGTLIEPIAFVVPRRSDSFQSDIFPPAPSSEPSMTAGEFFSGKNAPANLVSLENGAVTAATSSFSPSPAVAPPIALAKSASTPAPEPVKKQSEPAPAMARKQSEPLPSSLYESQMDSPVAMSPPSAVSETRTPQPQPMKSSSTDLEDENARLTAELREARALIRNLELQVEGLKANAQRAARALMDS